MNKETKNESWLADEPILILRYAKQSDNWLGRKIEFCRSMIGLAWKSNRFDLVENYRDCEDLFIKTRIFKNSSAKVKQKIKNDLEIKAEKRLKHLWESDFQNFIETLNCENDNRIDYLKNDFEKFKHEILNLATNHFNTE